MAHAMVEVRTHMGHAAERPGGALPDRLNTGHIQLSIPERSVLGRKAQHGPLPGLGGPPRISACRAFVLPR